jgi:hypothetical protein
MDKVNVDPTLVARLHNLDTTLEVCDTSGRTLGYFHPVLDRMPPASGPAKSPFSDEEIQQRRQQRSGRPLPEVLRRLGEEG